MPDSRRQESQDLEDYETRDANDTLEGNPGDDPLDRGVAAPGHWSAGMREAWAGEEDSESLDEHLAEEEPDVTAELDEEDGEDDKEDWDENETDGGGHPARPRRRRRPPGRPPGGGGSRRVRRRGRQSRTGRRAAGPRHRHRRR